MAEIILKGMEILGKPIMIKHHACNTADGPGRAVAPSVNIFVKVTKGCNARCLFCSNAGCIAPHSPFDTDKLMRIVDELTDKGIFVNRVNITGGEPSVASPLVCNILERMEAGPYRDIHLHLNTNGLLPESQTLMRHTRWNSISMSLHHYNTEKLSELYGCRISGNAFALEGVDRRKLNASCNLVSGYIDNAEEAHRMLDFTMELGIPRLGFVALMKVNDYCRSHFVDLEDIHINDIPHVHFTGSMNRGANCKCSNYLYSKGLKILEIYMRNYANPRYCASSLVFDGEFLRQGFQQDNIIY